MSKYLGSNTERLRKSRDLNVLELCEGAGITPPAYRSLREGKAAPRSKTLKAIAKFLEVEETDLLEEPPLELKSLHLMDKQIKNFEEHQIEYEISLKLKKFSSLEELLNKPKGNKALIEELQNQYNGDPKELARVARKKFGLDKDPINDICHLFESENIKIIPFKSDLNIFGACIGRDFEWGPSICVNIRNSITAERQIFTCALELGHLIMQEFSSEFSEIKKKSFVFAGNFLAPETHVMEKLKEYRGLHFVDQVLNVKNYFSISYRALLHRISEATETNYEMLKESFIGQYHLLYDKLLGDTDEPPPKQQIEFKEDRLSALVREAFEKGLIKMHEGAEVLDISPRAFRNIISSWNFIRI